MFFSLLVLYFVSILLACPPQPNGNCYYGTYQLSSSSGGFQNQQCGTATNRDWCAVSYMPATQQANFGCASNFPIQVGGSVCGEGPGFVNQQGCSMVNTDTGPCYFCCCKGGSCNHPQIFAREASKLPINQNQIGGIGTGGNGANVYNPYGQSGSYSGNGNGNYYPIPWYNTASQPSNPFFVVAIICFVLMFISFSFE